MDVAKTRMSAPPEGRRTARLDVRINPYIKDKLESLAKSAGMSTADLIEWWTQQATVHVDIPFEVSIQKTDDEYYSPPRPAFRVRPNGIGNPRWPRRYSVIRYNGDDAEHLLETDDYDVAAATCEAAAEAYIRKMDERGLAGYGKTYLK